MIESKKKIIIISSAGDLVTKVASLLNEAEYLVNIAKNTTEGLALLGKAPCALIISDCQPPDMSDFEFFDVIQHHYPALPFMILKEKAAITDAVSAIRKGVTDFLTNPIDPTFVRHAISQAIGESTHTQAQKTKDNRWREGIFTRSTQMEHLISQAKLVAETDASILIQGDSGTGKELLAHAIHQVSPRKNGPFVAINCGAMPETLLESELFGHAKGAFTGAVNAHKGLFQSAEGGTILLDEIGDMPTLLQVKLLRVLQERTIRPVGSNESIPINVRVISATHRNLIEEMKEKRFREDLYYRINVVCLSIPSLAERREDIPLIASNLLQTLCKRYNRKLKGFAPEAMQLLTAAPWPGNIRQLQNIVEQIVVLSTAPIVTSASVKKALHDDIAPVMPFDAARKAFERNYLINLLTMTSGNVAQSAHLAQRHRTEFYKLLDRHELAPAMFKENNENA
ncbi:MAG: two-component system response regulator GlrR [Betaproteobacteria bacterium HGW-Betaproteobacteria-22]|nr:MAG: two-component system response regulator GlrR [Betaproteobacteria bacterium HGW-Betaproteobacteria-22]